LIAKRILKLSQDGTDGEDKMAYKIKRTVWRNNPKFYAFSEEAGGNLKLIFGGGSWGSLVSSYGRVYKFNSKQERDAFVERDKFGKTYAIMSKDMVYDVGERKNFKAHEVAW